MSITVENIAIEPEVILETGTPIHRQIADQIRAHIVSGSLAPGEELPSPRALAVGLAVNVRAVGRAYRRLERAGYLTTVDNSGAFVSGSSPAVLRTLARPSRLERVCARLLERAARLGFSAEEVVSTLHTLTQRRSQS